MSIFLNTQALLAVIRKNLLVYTILRRLAYFFCKFVYLERGFSFLKTVKFHSGAVAIDIGSNDGTSVQMIRKAQPRSPIISFDPIKSVNRKFENHTYFNLGLSSQIGRRVFYIPKVRRFELTQYACFEREVAARLLSKDFGIKESEVSFRLIESQTTTLDSLKLKPYFIKIDVEGHELQVLKGSKETIQKYRPILLVEIQNLQCYQLIEAYLAQLNYKIYERPKRFSNRGSSLQSQSYQSSQVNYTWISEEKSWTWSFKD